MLTSAVDEILSVVPVENFFDKSEMRYGRGMVFPHMRGKEVNKHHFLAGTAPNSTDVWYVIREYMCIFVVFLYWTSDLVWTAILFWNYPHSRISHLIWTYQLLWTFWKHNLSIRKKLLRVFGPISHYPKMFTLQMVGDWVVGELQGFIAILAP